MSSKTRYTEEHGDSCPSGLSSPGNDHDSLKENDGLRGMTGAAAFQQPSARGVLRHLTAAEMDETICNLRSTIRWLEELRGEHDAARPALASHPVLASTTGRHHQLTAAEMDEVISRIQSTSHQLKELRGERNAARPVLASHPALVSTTTGWSRRYGCGPPACVCWTRSNTPEDQRGNTVVVRGGNGGASRLSSLRLGVDGTIAHWPLHTTLWYGVDRSSFPCDTDAGYVQACFEEAVAMWAPAPVRFQHVAAGCGDGGRSAATFVIRYRQMPEDSDTTALANAFFPGAPAAGRRIEVHEMALRYHRDWMVNILAHEIGHILGLRHEFHEPDALSVRAGPRDPFSVMNYPDHPAKILVSQLDFAGLWWLYLFPFGRYKGLPVVEVQPASI